MLHQQPSDEVVAGFLKNTWKQWMTGSIVEVSPNSRAHASFAFDRFLELYANASYVRVFLRECAPIPGEFLIGFGQHDSPTGVASIASFVLTNLRLVVLTETEFWEKEETNRYATIVLAEVETVEITGDSSFTLRIVTRSGEELTFKKVNPAPDQRLLERVIAKAKAGGTWSTIDTGSIRVTTGGQAEKPSPSGRQSSDASNLARFCPECKTAVSPQDEACPSCKLLLFAAPVQSWKTELAGPIAYLWGGLFGAVGLLIAYAVQWIGDFESRTFQVVMFAVFFFPASQAKKAALTARRDLAIWERAPTSGFTQEENKVEEPAVGSSPAPR